MMMVNGSNNTGEMNIQLPETKLVAEMGATMSGPLVSSRPSRSVHGKMDMAHVVLRLACLLTSLTALSVMTTAKQASTISLYGFSLPVSSKWSFSDSLE